MVEIDAPSPSNQCDPEETHAVVTVDTLGGPTREFLVGAGETVAVRSDQPVSVTVQTPPESEDEDD